MTPTPNKEIDGLTAAEMRATPEYQETMNHPDSGKLMDTLGELASIGREFILPQVERDEKVARLAAAIQSAGAFEIGGSPLLAEFTDSADLCGDPENEIFRFVWVDSDGDEFSEVITEEDLAGATVNGNRITISDPDGDVDLLLFALTPVLIPGSGSPTSQRNANEAARDTAFADYDFGVAYTVAATGGWEFDGDDTYRCSVFLEVVDSGEPTIKATFTARVVDGQVRGVTVACE